MNIKRDYTVIAQDVKSAQQGDAAAMDRLLLDVQGSVYYTCLRVLRSEDEAQDVTQEILITVFQKIGSLKDPGAYIGWVNRITANRCKRHLSRPDHEVFLTPDEDDSDPFAMFEQVDEQNVPDKVIDNAETQRMIIDLVNALSDEQRMCVMLYYYDGMKTREIADALDVSEGTVKSRLNYARKSIREGVKQYEKQGIKLYGISPIPFIGYFLSKAEGESVMPITTGMVRAAAAGTATTAAASGTTAAATAAAASGTAASGKAVSAVIAKIVTGVLTAGLLGGVGLGLYFGINRKPPVDTQNLVISTPDVNKPKGTQLYLYGTGEYRGMQFLVSQPYLGDGSIRLLYRNSDKTFALDWNDDVVYSLETTEGTYAQAYRYSGQQIAPKEQSYLDLQFDGAKGDPLSLTVSGIISVNAYGYPDSLDDNRFTIRFMTEQKPETTPAPATAEPAQKSEILSRGSVDYKGMTVSFEQTDADAIDLHFVNKGDYDIQLWFVDTGDFGFTVVAEDEHGRMETVVVKVAGSVPTVNAYTGTLDVTVPFSVLSGRIVGVKILKVAYENNKDRFDFGNSETIEIRAEQ